MDLRSRHLLSWKLISSLETAFCLEALELDLPVGVKADLPLRSSLPVQTHQVCGQAADGRVLIT